MKPPRRARGSRARVGAAEAKSVRCAGEASSSCLRSCRTRRAILPFQKVSRDARTKPCGNERLRGGARAEELHQGGEAFGPLDSARQRDGAQPRGEVGRAPISRGAANRGRRASSQQRTIASARRLAIRSAIEGVGLLQAPLDYVAPELATGRLVTVLDNWAPPPLAGYFLYHPSRRQSRPALKALVDFLRHARRETSARN